MADQIWVVVADQARARVFRVDGPNGPLVETEDIVHPAARLPEAELLSGARGQSAGGAKTRRNAYGSAGAEHANRRRAFARRIAARLEELRSRGELDGIYVVAEPRFLGALRAAFGAPLDACVRGERRRGLTKLAPRALRALLPERL